ncbi:MAG: glycosyltransferase [Flavobacteriales bacterium]
MSSQPLSILFTTSWFPGKAHHTLGNFVQRHAEAIALHHQVHVLYISALSGATSTTIEDTNENGVNITRVYFKPGVGNQLRCRLAFSKGLHHLLNEKALSFDLVHHNVIWPSGWQALRLKRQHSIPYIITEHFTIYDLLARQDQPLLLKWFSKKIARHAAALCPVSDDLGKKMQRYGLQGLYITVPNVVDTMLFKPGTTATDGATQFIHLSSLWDAQKNISGILKAWKNASDENPNIHLHIGGDGDFQHWQNVSHQLGINPHCIAFFGEKNPAEVAALMQQVQCLIQFSHFENLPVVILEAMACGLYVISSDVGGISEHIKPERGILIKPDDVAALAENILQIAKDNVQFDSLRIREYAVAHFSRAAIAARYTAVYREVLAGPRNDV